MHDRPPSELTAEQRRVLAALVERILPSDDGPGAGETGAVSYVLAALGEERLQSSLGLFRWGVEQIETLAGELGGSSCADASPEQRDEVLRRFATSPQAAHRSFLGQLVRLCVEGFAGAPGPGWHYLGYPLAEMEDNGCRKPGTG